LVTCYDFGLNSVIGSIIYLFPMSMETTNKPETKIPETKIKVTEDQEATGDTAAAYDYWRSGSGRQQVPGIIKCFGARPDFLRQVVDFSNTVHFSEGHLARRHKEMIASYVSFLNRCPY
jgi:hypothetical protein